MRGEAEVAFLASDEWNGLMICWFYYWQLREKKDI